LHKDDVDIKFSRALNSCKLPQIRYASKERLFERLTDLRFLSIDFLNTFLLTYRVFTTAEDVLEALKSVHYNNGERPFSFPSGQTAATRTGQPAAETSREQPPVPSSASWSQMLDSDGQQTGCGPSSSAGSCTLPTGRQPEGSRQQQVSAGEQQGADKSGSQQAPSSTPLQSPRALAGEAGEARAGVSGGGSLDGQRAKTATTRPAPPSVPPRSPQAHQHLDAACSASGAEQHLLAAPGQQQGSQKRRSTISVLTPITGSTSSSLANLSTSATAAPQTANKATRHSPGSATSTLEQQAPRAAPTAGLQGVQRCPNGPPGNPRGPFGEPAEDADQVGGASARARSASMCVQPPGQQCGAHAGLNQHAAAHCHTLAVPNARQARASSLSHVGVPLEPATAARLSPKLPETLHSAPMRPSRAPTSATPTGQEHWRLSYKKSSSRGGARSASGSGSGAHLLLSAASRACPPASALSPGNLLSPNADQVAAPARRKSAADVDKIKLEVTLAPNEAPQAASSEQNLARSGQLASGESSASADNSLGLLGLRVGAGSECCSSASPLVPPCTPTQLGSGSLGVAAGEEQRAVELEHHQRRSSGRRRASSYAKSAGSSSDEQGERAASSRSVSETELAERRLASGALSSAGEEQDAEEEPPGLARSGQGVARAAELGNGLLARRQSNERQRVAEVRRQRSLASQRQDSLLLKEIELATQSSGRLLDCDTSADESSAADDSSSADEPPDDQAEQYAHEQEHELEHRPSPAAAAGSASRPEGAPAEREQRAPAASQQPAGQPPGSPRRRPPPPAPSQGAPNGVCGPSASCVASPRSSFQQSAAENLLTSRAGVVVTSKSPRVSSRRSSTASAASAFAAATAASCNPLLTQPPGQLALARLGSQTPSSRLAKGDQQAAAADQAHCTCGGGGASGRAADLLASGPLHGSSIQLHRGSISSIQQQHRRLQGQPMVGGQHAAHCQLLLVASAQLQQQQQHSNHSVYFQPGNQQQQLAHHHHYHSDMSSVSLCNSRASSRLSSCAGLEFGASSNYYNQHPQQQQQLHQQLHLQHQLLARGRPTSGFQSGQSFGRFAGSQANLGYHHQAASKRNSSASAHTNVRSMATLRVLSVLRHWVSKHSQDFVNDAKLAYQAQEFLQDLILDSSLLPAEHKAAIQLQQMIQKATHSRSNQVDLDVLLAPPAKASPDSIESLSALEIAEGMTYLDHKIFLAIKSEEFLGQAWMKADKAIKAPHILLITKRFNDVSRLVSSEIIRVPELHRRVAIIEKWTNVAHICRVIHNFNGVLQICAAFTNSAVFRLKKTWDKIPKTTKATIDQLQNLVSTDSRFRNMRDAINRCDPPSIPYVGMYLTDLSFIEEGTPNYSPEGLLNFSKMRMVSPSLSLEGYL